MSENTKPRIAEILNVNVDEWFYIKTAPKGLPFKITEKGYFETKPRHVKGSTHWLLDAVNHPKYVTPVNLTSGPASSDAGKNEGGHDGT